MENQNKNNAINTCKKIAEYLLKIHENNLSEKYLNNKNKSLLIISLLFFKLSDLFSSRTYKKIAEKAIALIAENYDTPKNIEQLVLQGLIVMALIRDLYCEGDEDEILEDIDLYIFDFTNKVLTNKQNVSFREISLILIYYSYRLEKTSICQDDKQIMIMVYKELLNYLYWTITNNSIAIKEVENSLFYHFFSDSILLIGALSKLIQKNEDNAKEKRILKMVLQQIISTNPELEINKIQRYVVISLTNKIIKSRIINEHLNSLDNSIDIQKTIDSFDYELTNNSCHGAVSQLLLTCMFLKCVNKYELYNNQIAESLKIIDYIISKFLVQNKNPELIKNLAQTEFLFVILIKFIL